MFLSRTTYSWFVSFSLNFTDIWKALKMLISFWEINIDVTLEEGRFHLNFLISSGIQRHRGRGTISREWFHSFVRATLTGNEQKPGQLIRERALEKARGNETRPRPRSGRSGELSIASKFPSDPEECNFSGVFTSAVCTLARERWKVDVVCLGIIDL